MSHRGQYIRDSYRRSGPGGAGAGVTGITVNGGAVKTGIIDIRSPMAVDDAAQRIRVDNANMVALVDAATIVDVDVDKNTGFTVTLGGNRAMSAPVASIIGTPRDMEKITFVIEQGGGGPYTLTWTGGAGGYRFANAASPAVGGGIKLADFNTLLAAVPVGSKLRVGFEYDAADNTWDCVALAGYWP